MIGLLFKRKIPKISVIIPFFNVERYLDECIQSVLNQKELSLEIIMVDDGSTDRSVSIVKKYMKEHREIKLLYSNHRGPGGARNLGVKHAKGEFIAFVDADDILVKGIYNRMYTACVNNNAELCICNVARLKGDNISNSDLHNYVYKNYEPITHIKDNHALIYDSVSWNKLINRKFYERNKLKYEEEMVYEDILFSAQLYMKCNKTVMIAETGYLWRNRDEKNDASLSQTYFYKKNIVDRLRAVQGLLDYLNSEGATEALLNAAKYKILERDFKIVLDSVNHISDEESRDLFRQIQSFIEKNIGYEIIKRLPVVDMQRYSDVRDGKVEEYKKLLEYRNGAYYRAPIEERDRRLFAVLPKELINVESNDVTNEFARRSRRVWVDAVIEESEDIKIKTHLYIHRYNMAEPGGQDVTVKLVNEEFNEVINVDTIPERTAFLTEKFGEVYDEYTDTHTNYNYDYTGFSFNLAESLKNVSLGDKKKTYTVMADFADRIFRGRQIIKGDEKRNIEKYEKMEIKLMDRIIRIKLGMQQELQIEVSKYNSARVN